LPAWRLPAAPPSANTLSADVWLCAYQLGDRYRDDTVKPTVTAYDTVTSVPVRRTVLTYLVPAEGQPPAKHTLTCDAAPYGFGVIAQDGFPLSAPRARHISRQQTRSIRPCRAGLPTRSATAVRESGIHVQIAGIESF